MLTMFRSLALLTLSVLIPICGFSAQRVPADFDGDGKTDISLFRCSNGFWYLQQSSAGLREVGFGQCGDVAVPADYDGDGKTDVAVFRPSTGMWYIQGSRAGLIEIGFGESGDVPAPTSPANMFSISTIIQQVHRVRQQGQRLLVQSK